MADQKLREVHKFGDGSVLLVSGEKDEHGLPVAFVGQAVKNVEVKAHPLHQGMVVPGEEVPVLTRCPVSQVLELQTAGILDKSDKE